MLKAHRDRAKGCQLLTEVEGTQQDIEAQQVHKEIPHIIGQPQVIGILYRRQHISTII